MAQQYSFINNTTIMCYLVMNACVR
uniref:Uncharacterized protein n=1 Tax=Arundo donax TaxID=35708 RepID=A0A0A9FTC0_ARUDO